MEPLIELSKITKAYGEGAGEFRALNEVDLKIYPGDFVAIVGASGSGKSTLMNLMGCLDQPSSGHYFFRGQDVSSLTGESLARLRRERFGFVFQQYNLLPMDALSNVEVPAIYASAARSDRHKRALELLSRLGLEDRANHSPSALSGGQQQRVSIARALMNGADVILADEPTGALDRESGVAVLELLKGLHSEGQTIILITHDEKVAQVAQRQIAISDGRILSDSSCEDTRTEKGDGPPTTNPIFTGSGLPVHEAIFIALRSLRTGVFRAILTLLGIVIGVAAVIIMLAVGNGARDDVIDRLEAQGSDRILVRAGAPGQRRGTIASLVPDDAVALEQIPAVRNAVPEISGSVNLRAEGQDLRSNVMATSPSYFEVNNWPFAKGASFNDDDVERHAPMAVLGQTAARALFPNIQDPVGEWIVANNVPLQVVGILTPKGATSWGRDQDDVIVVPLTTGQTRLIGQRHLQSISVQVEQGADMMRTEEHLDQVLLQRHGIRDFSLRNMASLLQDIEETQNTLTLLLATIASVSLLVGGIGVMNIMLMSVSERTREIGVRMAIGARPSDIMVQFLVEAMVICLMGALLGVASGIGGGLLVEKFGTSISFTLLPILASALSALMIGLTFGILPAYRASRLDPVRALAAS